MGFTEVLRRDSRTSIFVPAIAGERRVQAPCSIVFCRHVTTNRTVTARNIPSPPLPRHARVDVLRAIMIAYLVHARAVRAGAITRTDSCRRESA